MRFLRPITTAKLNRSPNDSAFNRRLNLHPYAAEYVKKMLPRKYRAHALYGRFTNFIPPFAKNTRLQPKSN